MDSRVLVDAMIVVIGHQEKLLARPAMYMIGALVDMATTILSSREKVGLAPLALALALVVVLVIGTCTFV